MEKTAVTVDNVAEVANRFLRLYTGAISDILDKNGCRNQVLPNYITPFTIDNRVAGIAFTGQGYPCADTAHDDTPTRLKMLDSITPGTVSVWSTGGSTDCAHWGEIMSTAVRQRGCTGAVIDGGVRDVDFVNAMNYPVFAKFKSSASSLGRWDIVDCGISIKIGNTVIHPGDYIFGDTDGVVVIPKDMTMEVLVAAEGVFEREAGMREELRRGISVKDAYAKYGSL
ncbi:MAG: RraA family protein [Candidatus Solibacter sp.]